MNIKRTQTQIVNSLAQSFPRGRLFQAVGAEGSNLRKLLKGLAVELMRIEGKITDEQYNGYFINEGYDSLLEIWESILGIPDSCFSVIDKTKEERILQVLVKLNAGAVVTAQDFENLANILGYSCHVRAGVDVYSPPTKALRFTMVVNLPSELAPTDVFPLELPFILSSGGSSVVECLFNKLRPANVKVEYFYDI